MKKVLRLLFFAMCLSVVLSTTSFAATRTWDGGGADNNWSTAQNWAGDVIPGPTDDAVFDGTSNKTAVMDTDFFVDGFYIEPTHSGTVDLSTNTINWGANLGSRFDIDDSGGATLLSTGASIEMTANADDVFFDFTDDSYTFANFVINKTGGGDRRVDLTSGDLVVTGNMSFIQGMINSSGGAEFIADTGSNFTIADTFSGDGQVYLGVKIRIRSDLTLTDPTIDMQDTWSDTDWYIDGGDLILPDLTGENYLFRYLVVDSGGGAIVNPANEPVEISLDLIMEDGTFDPGNGDFDVNDDFIMNGGTYNAGAGFLNVDDEFTLNGGVFQGSSANIDLQDFQLNDGEFYAGPSGTLDITEQVTSIGSSVILDLEGKDFVLNALGTSFAFEAGTLNLGSGTINVNQSFQINEATLNCDTATLLVGQDFIVDSNGGASIVDCSSATSIGVARHFRVEDIGDNFIAPASTMYIGDDFNVREGAIFNHSNGTVEFDGAALSNYQNSYNKVVEFYNLIVNKSSNGLSIDGSVDIDVENDLSISSGNLDMNTSDMTLAGDFDLGASGTFTSASSEIIFDGVDQAITGSPTFNDFTKIAYSQSTLTFESGETVTVGGLSTLRGLSEVLALRASTPTSEAFFAPNGARNFYYLDVQDNNNTSGTTIDMTDFLGFDSGNNTDWTFGGAPSATINSLSLLPSLPGDLQNLIVSTNTTNTDHVLYNWTIDGETMTDIALDFETSFGNEGSVTFDSSGNGNQGIVSGATWGATNGYDGASGGYSFDGNDYITLPNISYDTITVAAWFNTDNIALEQRIVSKTQAGEYFIAINEGSTTCGSDNICFIVNVDGTYYSATYDTVSLSSDTWYHVAGVYDGTDLKLYLDGVEVDSTNAPGSIQGNSSPICIGEEAGISQCDAGDNFQGEIDNVIISERPFSAAQIALLGNESSVDFAPNFSRIHADETQVDEEWTVVATPVSNSNQEHGFSEYDSVTIQSGAGATIPEFSTYLLMISMLTGFVLIQKKYQLVKFN